MFQSQFTVVRVALLFLCVSLGVFSAPAFGGDVVVCGECGHEAGGKALFCSHCGVAVGGSIPEESEIAAEPAMPAEPDGKPSARLDAFVDGEIARALDLMNQNDFFGAQLALRNAAAVEYVAGVSDEAERPERIRGLLAQLRQGGIRVRARCEFCGGTGDGVLIGDALDGGRGRAAAVPSGCRHCGGSGYVTRFASGEELRFLSARASRSYEETQAAMKLGRAGNAWLPEELLSALTFSRVIALKKAAASPCRECAGMGMASCAQCGGFGRRKCPARNCVSGWIRAERAPRPGAAALGGRERCSLCAGAGSVGCDNCKERGAVFCSRCGGSGERPECRRCGAEGCYQCRRCRGAGVFRNEKCAECEGRGAVECSSCRGDGKSG